MRVLLSRHNRRMLTDLVESGGIVLCEEYFLIGFSKSFYEGESGYWVNTGTIQGYTDEEYSFFVREGEQIEVKCFSPILNLALE